MKIAFATYDLVDDVGGVSSWLRGLLPRLQAAGIEVDVHLLSLDGKPGTNCAWYKAHGISFRWATMEDTPRSVRHCLRFLEESQPDIYVPNCIYPAYFAASYARAQGISTVGVMHSDDSFYWSIAEDFIKGSERYRLSAMVSVSSFLASSLESEKNRSVLLEQIGYGVTIPKVQANPPGTFFRLIYAGRLVEEQKRISDVTRALCGAAQRFQNIEAWIAGEGNARGNVEKIIHDHPALATRVRLLGHIDNDKISDVLKDCHGFVLLSDFEGLPVSLLEAMAAGVVPICLDMRSGIREVIQPSVNGLIVQDREKDFFAAVENLQADPAQWQRLSTAARETIQRSYSVDASAQKWLELFHALKPATAKNPFKMPSHLHRPDSNQWYVTSRFWVVRQANRLLSQIFPAKFKKSVKALARRLANSLNERSS